MKGTRKKSIRRFLALALALIVWVSSVPSDTLAAEINHIHNEEGWTCTQSESGKTLNCEEAEHQHSDDCFAESQGELICGNEEADHEHTADCYSPSEKELVCGQSEHTHTDDCYEIVEGEWNCVKEEHEEETIIDDIEVQEPSQSSNKSVMRASQRTYKGTVTLYGTPEAAIKSGPTYGSKVKIDLGTRTGQSWNNVPQIIPQVSEYFVLNDGWTIDYVSVAGNSSGNRQPGASFLLGMSGGSMVYYFKRTAVSKTFTLNYNANGGSGAPAQQTATGTGNSYIFNISNTEPTRADYNFLGWSTDSKATSPSYYPDGSISVTGTTTLWAVWQKKAEKVTLTYMDRGSQYAKETYEKGADVTVKDCTNTKNDYTFKGWDTDPKATTVVYEVGDTFTINENMILYAVWEKNAPAETTYTVEWYDTEGNTIKGTETRNGTAGEEASVTEADKVVEGYTFDEDNAENVLNAEVKEDGSTVLKLYFEKNASEETAYKVEWYDTEGNTIKETETRNGTAGEEASVTEADKSVESYTFDEDNAENLLSAVVEEDGSTVLKLYFIRNQTPTSTPTATPTSTPGETEPTATPTATPGGTEPTATPTVTPGGTEPTTEPTSVPTTEPTSAPTTVPTTEPTSAPTTAPTSAPTTVPTSAPTSAPTTAPTTAPTSAPTTAPTTAPTAAPTSTPTPTPEVPANPTEPEEPTTPTEPEEPETPTPPVIRIVPEIPPVVTPQSPDMLVVIPDEDVARAVVYERVQDPVTEELSYEVNENVPVLEEVPEAVEEESPDTVIIIDEDVPQSYVKVQDPDTEDYVYIPEEDVPLASIGTPQTGDNSNSNFWMTLFMVSLGGMVFLVPDLKRRKKNR